MQHTRNYGIDGLRIYAMAAIVLLHFLYNGQIITSSQLYGSSKLVSFFLFAMVCGSVCVFAIISGYVGYTRNSQHKLADILYLWMQVTFYSLGIGILFYVWQPQSVSVRDLVGFATPFIHNIYWYFTAYVFVLLLYPFLNQLLAQAGPNDVKFYVCVGLGLLYVSHFFPGMYGIALLLCLYFLGSIIRKYSLEKQVSSRRLCCLILAWILGTFAWKLGFDYLYKSVSDIWFRSDFPITILGSCAVVMLFAKMSLRHYKWISFVCPSVFSIYLINDHPLVRKYVIAKAFDTWITGDTLYLIGILVGGTVLFMAGAIAIDRVRLFLFGVLKIKKLCIFLEEISRRWTVGLLDSLIKIIGISK